MLLVPTASPGSSWERTPSGPPSIHHPPSTIHHPPSTIHPPIRTAASVRQRRPPLVRHSRAWRLLLRPCGCVTLCAEERGQRGRRGQREQRPSRPAAVAAFKALPRRPPLLPSPSPLSTLRLPTVAAAVRLGSRPANRQQRPARTEERCMPARRGADSLRKKPSAPGKPVLRPSFLSVRPASSSAGFALETKPPRPSPLFVYESGCVRSFFPFSLSVRSLLALSLGPTDQPGCCRCCYVLPLFARQYAPPPRILSREVTHSRDRFFELDSNQSSSVTCSSFTVVGMRNPPPTPTLRSPPLQCGPQLWVRSPAFSVLLPLLVLILLLVAVRMQSSESLLNPHPSPTSTEACIRTRIEPPPLPVTACFHQRLTEQAKTRPASAKRQKKHKREHLRTKSLEPDRGRIAAG